MSKYIVEIKPEYEDSFKGLMILGAKDSNLFVDTLAVEDLEELNSDYINEHFYEMQDTAYQRGLNDAWEAARKIADMWTRIDNDELLAIFGITERIGHSAIKSLFGKQTANEAMLELEAYEEKQKAENEIKVGDDVRWGKDLIVITRLYIDGGFKWCDGISKDGIAFHVLEENVSKTNRHFDIESIMEAMSEAQ